MKYQKTGRTGCVRIEKGRRYFAAAFMLGFVGGILFANLAAKDYVTTSGIFNPYFLNQYTQSDIMGREYMLYLGSVRLLPFLLLVIAGQTKLRRILGISVVAWAGFAAGMLASGGIMNMGLQGIVFLLVGMAPQFLFYVLAYLMLLWYLFTYPQSGWNPAKTIFAGFFLTAGLLTEAYVNPILMKLFLKTL